MQRAAMGDAMRCIGTCNVLRFSGHFRAPHHTGHFATEAICLRLLSQKGGEFGKKGRQRGNMPAKSGNFATGKDMEPRLHSIKNMIYKALIFDLDGTLTDSLEDLRLATNHALRTMGWAERSLDEVRTFVGNGVHRLIERAVPQGTSPEGLEKCFGEFRTYYVEHCMDHTAPYAHIPEMLAALDSRGYRMAIVSNKLQAGVSVMHRQLYAEHVHVAIGEHAGVRRKPAPDMVIEAIGQLGVKPKDCVYVGDSDVDILTAQGAGLPCISVLWGFRDREFLLRHGATTLAAKPSDIVDIMDSGQVLPHPGTTQTQ